MLLKTKTKVTLVGLFAFFAGAAWYLSSTSYFKSEVKIDATKLAENLPLSNTNTNQTTENSGVSINPSDALTQKKRAMTTMFWVGEDADASNDYISNEGSFWDNAWQKSFGGIDNPKNRCGYNPCAFTPKENPFYVALPYAEFDQDGVLKKSLTQIPWYTEQTDKKKSLLKNTWVEVTYKNTTCYGQWEDVGPNNEDDFAYVFGSATAPTNTFGERAGLDVSPALATCLKMNDNAETTWRFVKASAVPPGPWKTIVTSSPINW